MEFDIQTSDYFITISKKSGMIQEKELFLNSLDYCLKAAKTDGRYARIFGKYGIQ